MLYISLGNFILLKTFITDVSYIKLWFTDQNSKPLEIKDKINNTLVINKRATYRKMTCNWIEHRDPIFVKVDRFLSFTKNISKNINKNLSGKNSPKKLLDHAKQAATSVLKTGSKRVIHKSSQKIWWFDW